MAEILVTLRAGGKYLFGQPDNSPSYRTNTIRYDGGFAIIADATGKETAIPADLILEIVTVHDRK